MSHNLFKLPRYDCSHEGFLPLNERILHIRLWPPSVFVWETPGEIGSDPLRFDLRPINRAHARAFSYRHVSHWSGVAFETPKGVPETRLRPQSPTWSDESGDFKFAVITLPFSSFSSSTCRQTEDAVGARGQTFLIFKARCGSRNEISLPVFQPLLWLLAITLHSSSLAGEEETSGKTGWGGGKCPLKNKEQP